MALALFLCWLFSSWISTTRPVGRWVIRTAESVVLTDWPPGPDERLTSIRRSFSSSISISTSSASGMTTTVAVEVWIRPDDSVAGIALDAVDAALELEAAVGAVAVDLDDRLLDALDARLVER